MTFKGTIGHYKVEKRLDALLDECAYKILHPSGLEVHYIPKKGYAKKFAYFSTRYGSLHNVFSLSEKEKLIMPVGVAHFLEHKIFESREKDIFDRFSKWGGHVNAYTGADGTSYVFSSARGFYKGLGLLLDFVQECHLTEEGIEKEKDIIYQEIKMYEDDPGWQVHFALLKAMYSDHPIREDVVGSFESVSNITKTHLQTCFDTFYTPQNMMIFIIGDLNLETLLETIDAHLSHSFLGKKVSPILNLPEESVAPFKKQTVVHKDVFTPYFELGIKCSPNKEGSSKSLYRQVALKLGLDIYFGKGSTFYRTNYDKGWINPTFYYEYSFGKGYSHVIFGGESVFYQNIFDALRKERERIQTDRINLDTFERLKNKTIGRYLSGFNSMQYIAGIFVVYSMRGIDIFDYLEVLDSLKVEDVEAQMRKDIDDTKMVESIVKERRA